MKTIVCDIDDTISFTTNRDWENAKPNLKLIEKLNDLYSKGWTIKFFTARGSLSQATREDAEEFYRPIILNWFHKHNVKYHELSFQKPLADYYIDDKSITPDNFIDLEIQTLQGGLSGDIVERYGDIVSKEHKSEGDALDVASWYNKAKSVCNVPKVHSIVGKTLRIEYLNCTREPKIQEIIELLKSFKHTLDDESSFDTYIERIQGHLTVIDNPDLQKIIEKLKEESLRFQTQTSFCHGDFTLENMICDESLYLIDPNRPNGLYSSWLLDASKLLMSAKKNEKQLLYMNILGEFKPYKDMLLLLEATHWIRLVKYANIKLAERAIFEATAILKELNVIND